MCLSFASLLKLNTRQLPTLPYGLFSKPVCVKDEEFRSLAMATTPQRVESKTRFCCGPPAAHSVVVYLSKSKLVCWLNSCCVAVSRLSKKIQTHAHTHTQYVTDDLNESKENVMAEGSQLTAWIKMLPGCWHLLKPAEKLPDSWWRVSTYKSIFAVVDVGMGRPPHPHTTLLPTPSHHSTISTTTKSIHFVHFVQDT